MRAEFWKDCEHMSLEIELDAAKLSAREEVTRLSEAFYKAVMGGLCVMASTIAASEPDKNANHATFDATFDAEFQTACEPLREYLKANGDPHTSVIITQYGATKTQDERRVIFDSENGAAVAKKTVPFIGINSELLDRIGYFWEVDSTGYSYTLRWREYVGGDANRICTLIRAPTLPMFRYSVQVCYDGNSDIAPKCGWLDAPSVTAALLEAERRVERNLREKEPNRLSAWKPANYSEKEKKE